MHGAATSTREPIGTILDAARLYGTDAAGVWAWICSGHPRIVGNELIRLHADPEKRTGALWLVEVERIKP